MKNVDVVICGAGAAGLTLAIDLARRGVSFRIVERLAAPFHGSRGKGIQPRSQEIFADLGLIDRLVGVGGLYPPQRAYGDDGSYTEKASAPHDPTPAEPYRLPLLVPQFLTERVMRERLLELGHAVEFGCALTSFAQDEEGVTVVLASAGADERVRAAYLVGADGGRSEIRGLLGIGFPGKTLGVRAMVADVTLTGLARDAWVRFHDSDMARHLSICPLAGTDLFQVQAPVPSDGDIDLSARGIGALIAARSTLPGIRVEEVRWASAYHMNARLADRYRAGRVFLTGDAAHVHPPTGGQGLNTSVQDAYNLGWKLAAVIQGADESLLDSYEEERRPVAMAMLGLSTRLLDAARQGDMRRGREVEQLDLGYPGSSLALDTRGRSGGLHAGDRAPDAPVRGAAGQPSRLFELFRGPHWTLLAWEVERDAALALQRPGLHVHTFGRHGDVIDDQGLVRDTYNLAAGDHVLVRPDGYIGAMVGADDVAQLDGHLRRMGRQGWGTVSGLLG